MSLPIDDALFTTCRAEVFALLADAERRATLAERKRCAKEVEQLADKLFVFADRYGGDAWLECQAVADAIRAG
jgi:hypothetical protein